MGICQAQFTTKAQPVSRLPLPCDLPLICSSYRIVCVCASPSGIR